VDIRHNSNSVYAFYLHLHVLYNRLSTIQGTLPSFFENMVLTKHFGKAASLFVIHTGHHIDAFPEPGGVGGDNLCFVSLINTAEHIIRLRSGKLHPKTAKIISYSSVAIGPIRTKRRLYSSRMGCDH
jgi:hypothetical protein